MNKYKIGYYYESKLVKYLRKLGYDAWRTPGSHSPVDIIAIHPVTNHILLIQVKSTSSNKYDFNNLDREERSRLLELAYRYRNNKNVDIQLWIFYRKFKRKKVIDIKKLLENS